MKKKLTGIIISIIFVVVIGLSGTIIFSNTSRVNAYSTNWSSYTSKPQKTQEGYYAIYNSKELAYISVNYTSFEYAEIRLCANINLSGNNWIPIASFKGTFDGQNFKIINMEVPANNYCGLFGSLTGANVSNVTFSNCNVKSFQYGGIVVGFVEQNTQINNIFIANSSVEVSYNNNSVDLYGGGLCGYLYNSAVNRCYINDTRVRVYSSNSNSDYNLWTYAGGIAGYSYESTISVSYFSAVGTYLNAADYRAYNYSNITYCGGIVGKQRSGSIDKCYNTSSMYGSADAYKDYKGTSYTGGIVGYSNSAIISNCYNTGLINAYAKEYADYSYSIETSASEWLQYADNINGGYDLFLAKGATKAGKKYSGNYAETSNSGTKQVKHVNCYTGGIAGYSSGTTISNNYNKGDVAVVGYIKNNITIYYKWKCTGWEKNCNLLIRFDIEYKERFYAGNIVGFSSDGANKISNNYFTSELVQYSAPSITQGYYVNGVHCYGNDQNRDAKITSWKDYSDQSNKTSVWYLNKGNGFGYYTFFTVNASNKQKIKFCVDYWGSKYHEGKKEYGSFDTKIPYTTASDGVNYVNIDLFGGTGLSAYNLGSTVWGSKSYINGGDPYIKDFYW